MNRAHRALLLAAAQLLVASTVAVADPVIQTTEGIGGSAGVAASVNVAVDSRTVTAQVASAPAPQNGIAARGAIAVTAEQRTRINAIAAAQSVLVWFKPGVSPSQRSELRASSGVTQVHASQLVQGVEIWDMQSATNRTRGQSQSLVLSSLVRAVEPDVTRHVTVEPNDPYKSTSLWGLGNIGAASAWDRTTGSKSIVVAVLDTGVRMDHEDLAANIWTNPGESGAKANNGIDDDHNGYIDDVHGWNFVGNNNNPTDDMFHGTHVAGTIGAVGNNGTGVVGVNWNVSIMPLKVCNKDGNCNLSKAMTALEYAVRMGARISNNSYGGYYEPSLIEQAMIAAANAAGHVFVAAAGNEYNDNDLYPSYPASYPQPNIISVEAIDDTADMAAYFTNYGDTTVDIAAPGVGIRSTDNADTSSYAVHSGTSMATPHVAGAAALLAAYWAQRGETWTVSQMKQRLLATARYPAVPLHNVSGGTLDLAAAIAFETATKVSAYVRLTGSGSGTVLSNYGNCNVHDCRITPNATSVETMTLVASAGANTSFLGWSGACSSTTETCTVTLAGLGPHVTARFGSGAATSAVRTFVESATALPAIADQRYLAFVKTVVSGDGNTRATSRYFNSVADNGWCFYETSTTGGVTIERLVNGVWVQDGTQLLSPPALTAGVPSSRWWNCYRFGEVMTMSGDGKVLAVNLGASLDTNRASPAMCGVAVYRRSEAGWSTPTVVHPAYVDCWTPPGDTLTAVADWRSIALDASGTRLAVAGERNLRLFNYDTNTATWALTNIGLPLQEGTCRLDKGTSVAFAADGKTLAFAWPACLVIGLDPSGHPNPDLDQYTRGRVLIYEASGDTWTVTADLTTDDSYTVGTMGLGNTLALSANGTTLVAGFQRTWNSVRDKTDYIGGAYIFEKSGSNWTFKRRIDNPRIDGNRMYFGDEFRCPIISADGTRIVCGQPSTSGFNPSQGWFEVLQRNGDSWTATPAATFLALGDGLTFDESRITSATANADTIYASIGEWRLVDYAFGDNVAGIVVTPSSLSATTSAPLLTNLSTTPTGFSAVVANPDPTLEYRAALISTTSATTPTVSYETTTATLTVTGMATASTASVAIGTWNGGSQVNERGITVSTSLLPANTPVLSAPQSVSGGFRTRITNLLTTNDVRYAAVIQSTTSETIPVIDWPWQSTETITVTNLSPGSSTTIALVLVQDLHEDSVVTASYTMATGAALVPQFETLTSGAKSFTAHIANFDPAFTWIAETLTTSSTVLAPVTRVDTATGYLVTSGIDAGETATVRVTAMRNGYATGTESITGTALPLAVTPILETTTATADGFTLVIGNFDQVHTWSAASSRAGASAAVSNGLVTVTGVPPGTLSTVTVFAARNGYESGTATSAAVQSITGPALLPTFDTATSMPHGYSVRISNTNASFTYSATVAHATAGVETATVSGAVIVTVTGLAATETATITVRTTRLGYETGTATFTGVALPPHRISFVTGTPTAIADQWHPQGDAVQWPLAPTSPGFTFNGWRNAAGAVETSTYLVQAADTMTAQWLAIQHSDSVTVGAPVSIAISDSATVQISIETMTAQETLTLVVASVASPAKLAAGLIAVSISATNESGTAVTSFQDPLRIDIGRADTVTGSIAWSTNGTQWQQVPRLAGTTLAAGQGDGWFVDALTGHVIILTRHLTSFGSVRLQSALTATSWWSTRVVGEQTQISVSGGDSTADITYASSNTGICTVSSSGMITATGAGTCLITVQKLGDATYVNTVSATVSVAVSAPAPPPAPPVFIGGGGGALPVLPLLAALTPQFGDATATADGYIFEITNFDGSYAWSAEVSASGASVAIDTSGRVTVTGLAPDSAATVTVRTTRTGYTAGSATTASVRALRRPALVPVFGSMASAFDAFTVPVTNFDSAYTWSVRVTSYAQSLAPVAEIDASGLVSVRSLLPGASASITVTAVRTGYETGTSVFTGNAQLLPALTPTFATPTSTDNGFTIRISNFDAAYLWSVTASNGYARIDGDLITVSGLAPSGFATVTVRATRAGFAPGESTSSAATALPGAALVPQFESLTATSDGFKLRIGNYDPAYAWRIAVVGTSSASVPSVTIDAQGNVVVTGVPAGAAAVLTVDVTRTGYVSAEAKVQGAAIARIVKPSITILGTALKRQVKVALGSAFAKKLVTVQIRVGSAYRTLFTATLDSQGATSRTASVPHLAQLRAQVAGKVIASVTAK